MKLFLVLIFPTVFDTYSMNLRFQRIFFAGTSRLTDAFPSLGGHLLDSAIRPTYGSRMLSGALEKRNRRIMKRVKVFRRILVIPDIHIGDAVLEQSTLIALRDFLPDAEIDYVVNRAAAPLIEGNPDATRVIPVFSNGRLPSSTDIASLRETIQGGRYDLCLNFSPFMERKDLAAPGQPLISFMSHSPTIVRNENDPAEINHFSYQMYRFVRGLLSMVAQPVRTENFRGVRTTYSDEAIESALRFSKTGDLSHGSPVIMVNPDSSIRFNLIPFEHQAALLGLLARNTPPDVAILLGAGHTEAGIGERLAATIPSPLRSKIRIIPPSMPLEVFSALIDSADVFISGDTGPLHLAAARRYSRSGRHQFRNRTAIMSLFGATVPRMSGYDSSQPGYLPANQDAPSWCYLAGSRCRNITCLNKMFKTCATVRCFEQVDTADLANVITSHIGGLARKSAVIPGRDSSVQPDL